MDWSNCTTMALVFILTFLFIIKIGGVWSNHQRKKFPPGPRALPIIGNLHLFDLKRPYRTYLQVAIIFYAGLNAGSNDPCGSLPGYPILFFRIFYDPIVHIITHKCIVKDAREFPFSSVMILNEIFVPTCLHECHNRRFERTLRCSFGK